MRAAFRLALLLLTLALPAWAEVPSWDDPAWYAAPPNPLNLTMTADADRSVAATIGPSGGTFSATGANGDVYTLTIPEGALFTDTRISILPVTSAEGLPEGAGPFSGVILLPDGLELAKTGWLEITPATPIPAENRALWGFYGTGQDARGEINWPGAGERIVIPLDHFSGAGVSIADRVNLELDKWKQKRLEDRVRSQLADAIRQQRTVLKADPTADVSRMEDLGNMADRLGRTLNRGFNQILSNPAATCADVQATVQAILSLRRQQELLGLGQDAQIQEDFRGYFDRYWQACFPEEVQVCLRTGDLKTLVTFAVKFERQRQLVLFLGDDNSGYARIESEVRAAIERCGRFELEVTSQGSYQSDGGGDGTYSFSARIPLRLTFDEPNGFNYRIYGEGPPTNVTVTPTFVPEYVAYKGHRVTEGLASRITTYEFSGDDKHLPVKLEALISAPSIIATFAATTFAMEMPLPVVESAWYLAHKGDLAADAFQLKRFQPRRHPVLFEMDWIGEGSAEDAVMSDSTRLRLIHIAQ